MKPSLTIYSCFLTIWLFSGCDKPKLTPITQEGKNTFSCKVNGKVWVPDGGGGIFVTSKPVNGGFYLNPFNGTRNIEIRAYKEGRETVVLFLRTIALGRHELNRNTKVSGESFYPENYGFYSSSLGINYKTSEDYTGYVNISKADTISGIISGTFEFKVGNSQNEAANITGGRFDIKSPQ